MHIEEIERHFGLDDESQQKIIETFLSKIHDKPVYSKETNLLEESLARMDNRSLQRLLRDMDICTLAVAMSGSSGSIQIRILKSASRKSVILIINEIETMDFPSVPDITNSQKQVLETIVSLKNQGDII